MFKTILCLHLLVLLNVCDSVTNKCAFRGKCGDFKSTVTGDTYPIPCEYSKDPKPFQNKTILNELKQLTPELFKAETPLFCCDENQVSDTLKQISIARDLMKRCSSCFVNFAKIFFHMTCAPNQAEFIEVTKWSPSTVSKPQAQHMVNELTYHVSNKFVNDTYNSCKNVQFPSAPVKVVSVMCGKYGADCNPQRFLQYLGTKDPSPIQINFQISNDTNGIKTFSPMNAETVSCATAPIGYSNSSCNCADCPVNCTPHSSTASYLS